jgi:hypothetical protein
MDAPPQPFFRSRLGSNQAFELNRKDNASPARTEGPRVFWACRRFDLKVSLSFLPSRDENVPPGLHLDPAVVSSPPVS